MCERDDARLQSPRAQALGGEAVQRLDIDASRRFLGHVAEPRALVVFLSPPAGEADGSRN